MTYKPTVSGWTLNPTHSLTHCMLLLLGPLEIAECTESRPSADSNNFTKTKMYITSKCGSLRVLCDI